MRDFRERGLFAPPHIHEQPQKGLSWMELRIVSHENTYAGIDDTFLGQLLTLFFFKVNFLGFKLYCFTISKMFQSHVISTEIPQDVFFQSISRVCLKINFHSPTKAVIYSNGLTPSHPEAKNRLCHRFPHGRLYCHF